MMHDKAFRAICALSSSLVLCGFAACAGTDVPPTDEDLRNDIATGYANGVGVSGASGGGSAGAGGRAPAAGNGGDDGNDPPPAGGAGGSDEGGAGGGGGSEEPPPGGDDCGAFELLVEKCGSSGCHGPNSGVGNFAETLEDAQSFVGADPVTPGCADEGPVFDTADPGQSLVIQKVDGSAPCGGPMPLVGAALTDEEITCLEDWISTL